MIRTLTASLLLGAALITMSCASTATGISQSRLAKVTPNQSLNVDVPQGSVLAVVRYPAFVEDAASEAYYKAYSRSAIGGTLSTSSANSPDVQALGDSVILKSNYFAMSLYKELAAKLPEHSVLLSPHAIKLDADGTLTLSR